MTNHRERPLSAPRLALGIASVLAIWLLPASTLAQEAPENPTPSSDPDLPLALEADLPAEGWIGSDAPLSLRLSRPPAPGERVAVFVGPTDYTDLFRPVPDGRELRYAPRGIRFPAGEQELVVYRVGAEGSWQELGRFPMRVRGALGLETSRVAPSLDLSVEGQLAEGHEPQSAAPQRDTYQDFTGQLSLDLEGTRGSFRSAVRASAIGVSHRPAALRFGELQEDAPKLDLSDYVVQVDFGRHGLSQGHVSAGNQRHLISGFSSRGALLSSRPVDRVDLSLAALNGSSLVGWENFLGLSDADHRILSGTLGVEAFDRPGLLRLELSGMDGSVLPISGFNQGVVNDAEESRGVGAVLTASDPSGRLRLEGGFARSTFRNPEDPTLAQDDQLVPVEEETRNARYLEASVGVLPELRLSEGRTIGLTLGWRHERVDPLYRSLGAYAGADQLQNAFEAQAQVARIGLRASLARSEDNLDEIPSILKTKTRRGGLTVDVPLTTLFTPDGFGAGIRWLPRLSWGFDRTRQFGAGLPENGGFDPSHVPDQVSTSHTASADWELATWLTVGYRLSRSRQDNRQPGRETADFTNRTHGIGAGLRPLGTLSFDLSLDVEEAENHERGEADDTWRAGVRSTWSPFQQSTVSASVSRTVSEDEADTRRRANTQLDAQWASFIPGLSPVGGQYYLRFARSVDRSRDRTFELDDRLENWVLSSGLTFSFSP